MKAFGFIRTAITLGLIFSLTLVCRAQTSGGTPPVGFSVNILTPFNAEHFNLGENITITVNARDTNVFINTMFIYEGTNQLAGWILDPVVPLPTNGDSLTLSYVWSNAPPGSYTLTAVAGNISGATVTSPPVNITVGPVSELTPVVNIIATDPIAVEPGTNTNHIIFPPIATPGYRIFTNYCSGTNTATFLVRRFSPTAVAIPPSYSNDLTVYYSIGGTASNGVDYVTLPGYVTIPAYKNYALITIVPLEDNDPSNSPPFSTVILTLIPPPTDNPLPSPYIIGWPGKAGAIILEEGLYPIGPPIGPIGNPIVGGPSPVAPFHFCCAATNGMTYCMEVSSNLVDWLPVCTNMVVKNRIHFLDPESPNYMYRYYRAVTASGIPVF